MKNIIILGSTGSIGRNALDAIRRSKNKFKVLGLSAQSNTTLLSKQLDEFRPRYVSILDKDKYHKFKSRSSCKLLVGEVGLMELAGIKTDILVLGISGLAALRPLILSLGKAKRLLLANKESIISAGDIVIDKMHKSSTEVLPVDSEAWAVFNLIKFTKPQDLLNIYITASGGPLLNTPKNRIKNVSRDLVLKHPVWNMGKRISIDSATLMNKGFEVMEISRLFGVSVDRIKVLVHPQSIVHAMLERKDRNLLSCLFFTDMRVPIAASLNYPGIPSFVKALSLEKIGRLEFLKPDTGRFPSLELAYSVAKRQKSFPAVLVSADEEAVNLFLEGKIKFNRIYDVVRKVVDSHRARGIESLEDVFYCEAWAREKTRQIASRFRYS